MHGGWIRGGRMSRKLFLHHLDERPRRTLVEGNEAAINCEGNSTPERRLVLILRVYVDDSGINQPPMSVLAGWIGPAERWAAFSDEWHQALQMKPRLKYFKMSEAMSLSGEFSGWSTESRDHRLKYLANLIAEYQLIGVGTAIPHDLYQEIFVGRATKIFDVPYYLMFYALMAGIVTEFHRKQIIFERIDFVFDQQPGQMDRLSNGWAKFKEVAPAPVRTLLGDPPIFRSDETTLPIQAADMYAWYVRVWNAAEYHGQPAPPAPWAPAGGILNTVTWVWDRQQLQGAFDAVINANRLGVPVEIWTKN